MAELILKNLSKNYNGTLAVKDLSLHIEDGEFLVLLGPSGCGKTTTLRMIAGLETPNAGEICMDGKRVDTVLPKDRDMAMVFQDYALYPHMTVFDNIGFGLKMRKTPKAEIAARVTEAAKMLNVEHLLKRRPNALSGGERQRAALGRAIVRRPKVFLFDEPLSNLDAALRVQMRSELSRLHRELKTTFVYVTHDQIEAMTMASRIAVLDHGVLQQTGTPDEIYNNPANTFVAGFIGSPKMNLIPCMFETRMGELFLCVGRQEVTLPERVRQGIFEHRLVGKPMRLGIRAEHLRLGGGLNATVQYRENTGADAYLYVKLPDDAGTAVVRTDPANNAQGEIGLEIDWQHARLFNEAGDGVDF